MNHLIDMTDHNLIADAATLRLAVNEADFYKSRHLVDAENGIPVRYEAIEVPGEGWSVARVTGSNRTSKTIERALGFEGRPPYNKTQAQWVARVRERALFRYIEGRDAATVPAGGEDFDARR